MNGEHSKQVESVSTDQEVNYGMVVPVPVCAHVARRVGGDLTRMGTATLDPCPWCEVVRLTNENATLQRVVNAAREFADNFPSTYVDDGNCRKEWRELNEALSAGDAP